MAAALRRYAGYIVAGVIGSLLTAGGPSALAAAYDAMNSDKVDGKHAVGAGATAAQRAGKLVATNSSGRLPDGIIAKAPNADRLDGLDSTSFNRSTVGSGQLITGTYSAYGGPDAWMGETVRFGARIAAPAMQYRVIRENAARPAVCPGPGKAARGYLCIYETLGHNWVWGKPVNPRDVDSHTSRWDFTIFFLTGSDGGAFSHGQWAIRVP